MTSNSIHRGQPVIREGQPLSEAKAAMVMIHGRGARPADILVLNHHFTADGFAYLAPAAQGQAWYPDRFLVPREKNEPHLSSALATVGDVLAEVKQAGISPEKTILLGFSQGGCLTLDYAARNPQRYGGVVALSGGLIGADDELDGYTGSLSGTPVFIGCSDTDFHIPVERVHKTAEILQGLDADVDKRIYPGMGHTVIQDEIDAVNAMMAALAE